MSLSPAIAEPASPGQRKVGGGPALAPGGMIPGQSGAHGVDAVGAGADTQGAPPVDLRSRVEQATGVPLDDVRLHEGPGAANAAHAAGALAFASGSDVVLGPQAEGPGVPGRDRLIAHELVHAAQQRSAGAPHASSEDAEREADAGAEAALAGQTLPQPLGSAPSGVPQRAPAPYDTTQFTIPPLPSGYTLATLTTELKKKETATPPAIKSWKATGVTSGSTEELYVLYAVFAVAKASRWGTEVDLVTEVGPGVKGSIQVTIDAAGNAVGTLVSGAAPAVAATFATELAAIAGLKTKYGLTDVIGEKSQTWTLERLNKVAGAWGGGRLSTAEAAALSGYKLIITDNTLTGPDGTSASGLTTRGDKTSADGLTAIKTREIRYTVGMFDADLTSFTGDSSNAAPASYLTLLHEVAHAQESKVVDDANSAEVAATVEPNKVIQAGNAANRKTVASRNAAVVGHWNKFKAADQTASKPLVDAFDAAHDAITKFRDETDPTKMAALEAPAQAAIAARDTAKTAVPAKNPAHAAFASAIPDQDAYLRVVQDLLAKRKAQATAAANTAAAKDPTGKRSKRLQAFVDFVTANSIKPVTKYAEDNWPAKPAEFYAEAFSLWHNDPTFFGTYSSKLKGWFDAGEHLK